MKQHSNSPREVCLGEICEIIMGQAPASESYNYDRVGLPLIAGASDFGEKFPKAKKYTSEASKICDSGDIILGIRATIGEKVFANRKYCLGRGVAALRPRSSATLNINYLWHWLDYIKPQLAMKSKGATFKQVSKDDISELNIILPFISEQRRIATILDQADALRTKRRAAITELDKLVQSIFLDMFGNPIFNSKKWPIKKLSEVGTLDRGVSKHRPRNAPELLNGSYPLIQTGDVANCNGYILKYNSTYSEVGLRQSKMWKAGTLCITIAANIAKTGILTFDACFPDSIVSFHSKEYSTIEFVRIWLSFLQKMLEENAPESAQKNINLAILRNLDIPFPPIELQRNFAEHLKKLEELKTTAQSSLTELDALFASLQHRAFRGEL